MEACCSPSCIGGKNEREKQLRPTCHPQRLRAEAAALCICSPCCSSRALKQLWRWKKQEGWPSTACLGLTGTGLILWLWVFPSLLCFWRGLKNECKVLPSNFRIFAGFQKQEPQTCKWWVRAFQCMQYSPGVSWNQWQTPGPQQFGKWGPLLKAGLQSIQVSLREICFPSF